MLPAQEEQQTTASNHLKGTYSGIFGCHHLTYVLNHLLGLSQLASLECLFPELAVFTACV